MEKSHNVIRDDMTRTGRIDAVEGLHEHLDFTYRPMLAEETETVQDAIDKVSTRDFTRLVAQATCNHVVTWSEAGPKDGELPVTLDNVRRLGVMLLYRLYRIVAQREPTDEVPGAADDELQERLAALNRQVDGVSPAQHEEDEAKNLGKG